MLKKYFGKNLGKICPSQWNNVKLYEGFTRDIWPPCGGKKKEKDENEEMMKQRSVLEQGGEGPLMPFADLNMLPLQGLLHILQPSEF